MKCHRQMRFEHLCASVRCCCLSIFYILGNFAYAMLYRKLGNPIDVWIVAKEYVSATSAPSQLSTFQLMKFFPKHAQTRIQTCISLFVCAGACVCVYLCVCEGVASVGITSYLLQASFRYWQITWQCHRIRSSSWTRSTGRVDGWQIVTVKVNTVTLKVQAAKSQEKDREKPFIATQHVKLAVIKECMSGVR